MRRIVLAGLSLIASVWPGSAVTHEVFPTCETVSLAVRIASGPCVIADLAYLDFGYSVISATGVVPPQPEEIGVTPAVKGLQRDLFFSSPAFSVPAGARFEILISYTVDPHPIIDFAESDLFAFTPVFPGFAQIDTRLCLDQSYSPDCVTGATLSVNHQGITSQPSDAVAFDSLQRLIGVEIRITLDALRGGSADFSGFSTDFRTTATPEAAPEPSSLLLLGSALVAAGLLARARGRLRRGSPGTKRP